MKQNIGILDTAIRSVVACAMLAVAIEGLYGNTVTAILTVVGSLLFISSSFGICFLYKLLRIDTYPDFSDDSYKAH